MSQGMERLTPAAETRPAHAPVNIAFARLDLNQVKARLANPIIFDGRNLYEPEEMTDRVFVYVNMGRPAAEELAEALPLARRA